MRLSEVITEKSQLDEVLPALAAGAAKVGAQALGGVAKMAGSMLGGSKPATPSTTQPAAGPVAGQMDPAQAAQAAKERTEQKKQVQDQIKQTEQQLIDLRKKLAELG